MTRKISVLFVILPNLVPLYGVIALNWDIFTILAVYFIETALAGLFTALKIFLTTFSPKRRTKNYYIRLILGDVLIGLPLLSIFLIGVFFFKQNLYGSLVFSPPEVNVGNFTLPILFFTLNQAVSFAVFYFNERNFLTPKYLANHFLTRIIIIFLTIWLGGFFAKTFGNASFLMAFILLCTSVQILYELKEPIMLSSNFWIGPPIETEEGYAKYESVLAKMGWSQEKIQKHLQDLRSFNNRFQE